MNRENPEPEDEVEEHIAAALAATDRSQVRYFLRQAWGINRAITRRGEQ